MSYSAFIFVDSPECIWSLEEQSGTDVLPDNFVTDPLYNGVYNTSKISRSSVPITIDGKTSIYNSPTATPGDTLFTIPSIDIFGAAKTTTPYTLEFWMNLGIDETTLPDAISGRMGESKIVGFTGSTETGLYIRDLDYLVFKLGDTGKTIYESSVHVPDFNTPLHIAMIYYTDSIQIIVNGIEGSRQIFFDNPLGSYEQRNIEFKFPSKISADAVNFSRINYDTIAIYRHSLDSSILKRHYVYGLGKDVPGVLIKSLAGTQYGVNLQKTLPQKQIRYFNRASWTSNVIFNNLSINDYTVSTKKFNAPNFSIFRSGYSPTEKDMINSSNEIVFPENYFSYVEIPNYEGITGGSTKKVEAKLSIGVSHNNTSVEQTLMHVSSRTNPSKYISFRMVNRVISFYTSNAPTTALFTYTVPGTGAASFILSYYVDGGTIYAKILGSSTSASESISANQLFPMQDAYIRFGSEPAFFGTQIPANILPSDVKRFDGSLLQVDIYDSNQATANFSSYPTRQQSSMYQMYVDGKIKKHCIATSGTFSFNISLLDLATYSNLGVLCNSVDLAIKSIVGSAATKIKYSLVRISNGVETVIESNKDLRNIHLPKVNSAYKVEELMYKVTGTLHSSDTNNYPGVLDYILIQSYPTKLDSTKSYLEVSSDNAGENIRYYSGQTSSVNNPFKYMPEIDQTTDMHRSFYTGFPVGTIESGVSPYAMIPFSVKDISATNPTNKIYCVMFTGIPYTGTVSNIKVLKIGSVEISLGSPEPSGVEFYINGLRYDSGTTYDFSTATHFIVKFTAGVSTPADIYFGFNSTASFFLDNISVFTKNLSTNEIAELYAKFFSSFPTKVIAGHPSFIVGSINKSIPYLGAINLNDREVSDGSKKYQPLFSQTGFHPLSSCPNLASTANLGIVSVSGSTFSFTFGINKDLIKMDNTEILLNDLILLKNQSTASQNGIYLITAKTATALTLVKQADPTNGNLVFVKGGNSNKNYYFQKNSNTYTKQVIQPKIVSYDKGRPNITQPITF